MTLGETSKGARGPIQLGSLLLRPGYFELGLSVEEGFCSLSFMAARSVPTVARVVSFLTHTLAHHSLL